MPEVNQRVWYYTLKTKTASVKLGKNNAGCLRVESLYSSDKESDLLAERFNNLSFNDRGRFISGGRDFNYDPPRESVESCVRERIEALGWFEEFELEYMLSPPNEKYIGPGSKEYEENEKRIEQEKRDGTYVEIVF